MKILVADDDAVSRLVMQRMLRKAGYDVVLTDNGHAAVESLLSRNGPRLALIDWMMPGLDGPAVCREIRACRDRAYIYITVLTSRDSTEDLVAGLEAGADDYLTKPCNNAELKARLLAGERILHLEDTLVSAREEMRFKATHDPLTALWNREAILGHLNAALEEARRVQKPVSLILGDIDYFKQINDAYGHLVGDETLKEMADRLQSAASPRGMVGRYGGEEFLIVLPGCDAESLRARAEHLRESVASEVFAACSHTLSLSISLGALTVAGPALQQRIEMLLSQADVALYRAKMEGRNRAVIARSDRSMERSQDNAADSGTIGQGSTSLQ